VSFIGTSNAPAFDSVVTKRPAARKCTPNVDLKIVALVARIGA